MQLSASAVVVAVALVLFANPVMARKPVTCGDVLTPEQRTAGFVSAPQSRGRLAGELGFDPRLRQEPGLLAALRAATAAEQQSLLKLLKGRDRADGRLCWARTATIMVSHPRIVSVLVEDGTEFEQIAHVELRRTALLWDRAAGRLLNLADLIDLDAGSPAFDTLVEHLVDRLDHEKRDRDMTEDKGTLAIYGEHIREELAQGSATAVLTAAKNDPSRIAGLTFHYDSGELGSRMEHTYELFVPASMITERIRPAWRSVFSEPGSDKR